MSERLSFKHWNRTKIPLRTKPPSDQNPPLAKTQRSVYLRHGIRRYPGRSVVNLMGMDLLLNGLLQRLLKRGADVLYSGDGGLLMMHSNRGCGGGMWGLGGLGRRWGDSGRGGDTHRGAANGCLYVKLRMKNGLKFIKWLTKGHQWNLINHKEMFANANIINQLNDQVIANFNPLPPYVPQRERLAKILILI